MFTLYLKNRYMSHYSNSRDEAHLNTCRRSACSREKRSF
ncbi:hypothetical protein PCARR_b0145 [Pseudoalteromonas carrageenovora IAM 12662]|uniref:Uncharacterized protein n=1 Tax=Pseudoalteromonas carrageenovora IAM 12662 TaxID=1314868 RepID=A0ABR9EUH3_PSEVC|nr:hypothetical protein [Pseudoalteromonas carrageenovora IAM 12662]